MCYCDICNKNLKLEYHCLCDEYKLIKEYIYVNENNKTLENINVENDYLRSLVFKCFDIAILDEMKIKFDNFGFFQNKTPKLDLTTIQIKNDCEVIFSNIFNHKLNQTRYIRALFKKCINSTYKIKI